MRAIARIRAAIVASAQASLSMMRPFKKEAGWFPSPLLDLLCDLHFILDWEPRHYRRRMFFLDCDRDCPGFPAPGWNRDP